ncbi:hydroxyisocaproate dehydrogenase [Scheffersomyces xylosifermentans]|uniref:hydroxyisocaproate dehydrogenase n=1 Tax=Scheffersomyces xylosifermentans TaxID=1304137 RepID=UPI00315CD273
MTIKPQVLFIGKPNTNTQEYKTFSSRFECIHYKVTSLAQLLEDFQTKFRYIEAIYAGWGGFDSVGGFHGEVLRMAPPNLKIIAICSIGYDGFDLEGMQKKGIILTNVPSQIASEAVADLVLYNTLSSFRNFKIFEQNMKGKLTHTGVLRTSLVHGKFDQFHGEAVVRPVTGNIFASSCCGREILSPRGHNVVIVGFGSIGKLVGQRLSSIGMNIHYVTRNKLSAAEEMDLGYKVNYHETLKSARDVVDLLVIACPGTPSTRHMIDRQMIEDISKPFRLINIGRGYIVDENALIEGLQSGKILFAGLDVFENEPSIHPDLLNRQDVVLTPHIGSSTTENFDYTAATAMQNIEAVLFDTQEKINSVN